MTHVAEITMVCKTTGVHCANGIPVSSATDKELDVCIPKDVFAPGNYTLKVRQWAGQNVDQMKGLPMTFFSSPIVERKSVTIVEEEVCPMTKSATISITVKDLKLNIKDSKLTVRLSSSVGTPLLV